jgi:hypothetical protein
MTRAHRKAGTLLEAPPARCAPRRDLDPRRIAAAVVLALVGAALALCCCLDHAGARSGTAAAILTDWAAPGLLSADDPGQPAAQRTVLDGLPSSRSAPASVREGRGLSAADPCDSGGVVIEVGTEAGGRAAPTPLPAAGVVAAASPRPPALVQTGGAPLLDHLSTRLSPYRLCVMRR